MIASHVFPVGMKSAQQLGCQKVSYFFATKTGEELAAEAFRGYSWHLAAPPCCSAELQMGLTLWLIKDLPGESAVMSLTFKQARSGSNCTKMVSALRTRGGRKLTNDFSGFARWQRWQAVNRENAISFVVNYQPTQSDTRQRKSSCSDSSFSCHAVHTSAKTTAPHTQTRSTLLPTCTNKTNKTKHTPT